MSSMDSRYSRDEMAADNKRHVARINAYWLERGHYVNARIAYTNGLTGWPKIVSDTVDGMPRKR